MKPQSVFLAVALALAASPTAISAQQPASPAFSTAASAERIVNLDTLKAELRQFHDCTCKCGCYASDLDLQADRAIAFLRHRAAQRQPNQKLALILDIDETTLSNYPEMLQAGFAYRVPEFNAWVDSARAAAIPGTLRLYNAAQRLRVAVFFITGRPDSQRAVTERNLRAQGFQNWKQLSFRPAGNSQSTVAYKSAARAQIAAQGYTLVLNVGDQWSDLNGNPRAEFNVKYPNPYYFIP